LIGGIRGADQVMWSVLWNQAAFVAFRFPNWCTVNMTDRQLLQSLMLDFAIGAALGAVFAGLLLFLNIQHLLDAVQSSGAPTTFGVILVAGCSAYFGFGATVTGFHFALMGGEAERF
jgi:hypothetical protein